MCLLTRPAPSPRSQLKAKLTSIGLPTDGLKAVLKARLLAAIGRPDDDECGESGEDGGTHDSHDTRGAARRMRIPWHYDDFYALDVHGIIGVRAAFGESSIFPKGSPVLLCEGGCGEDVYTLAMGTADRCDGCDDTFCEDCMSTDSYHNEQFDAFQREEEADIRTADDCLGPPAGQEGGGDNEEEEDDNEEEEDDNEEAPMSYEEEGGQKGSVCAEDTSRVWFCPDLICNPYRSSNRSGMLCNTCANKWVRAERLNVSTVPLLNRVWVPMGAPRRLRLNSDVYDHSEPSDPIYSEPSDPGLDTTTFSKRLAFLAPRQLYKSDTFTGTALCPLGCGAFETGDEFSGPGMLHEHLDDHKQCTRVRAGTNCWGAGGKEFYADSSDEGSISYDDDFEGAGFDAYVQSI